MNGSRLRIMIAGLVVALSLVGCAMQPAFEDPNVVSQIHAGRTNKADVQTMLGQPADEVTLPGTGDMWTYRDIQPSTPDAKLWATNRSGTNGSTRRTPGRKSK